jgi:hypothetical protein
LDERHFRRFDKYDGAAKTNWRECAFQFKVAVGMVNPKARSPLEDIQKAGKQVNFQEGTSKNPDTEKSSTVSQQRGTPKNEAFRGNYLRR